MYVDEIKHKGTENELKKSRLVVQACNDESKQATSGRLISSAFSIVDLTEAPMSYPWAIPYNSEAKTLLVTLLHFVDDQWSILARLAPRTRIYPIYDERSLLFMNDASVKTSRWPKPLAFASPSSLHQNRQHSITILLVRARFVLCRRNESMRF